MHVFAAVSDVKLQLWN